MQRCELRLVSSSRQICVHDSIAWLIGAVLLDSCQIPRKITKHIEFDSTILHLLFSPDMTSSFMAIVDGTTKCSVLSTESWELVQVVPSSRNCRLNSVAFDPSGTVLVIGGKAPSLHSETGGLLLVVRVGELLRLDFFSIGTDFTEPSMLYEKLSSLSATERAQILFHRSDFAWESADHSHFPLERNIRSGLATMEEEDSKASLGSTKMKTKPKFERVMWCLTEILTRFPQTAFAGCGGHGNMFDIILKRDNPRLLKLLFYVTLVSCRSFPYMIMNEEMRNGTVTKALIASCDPFPEGRSIRVVDNPAFVGMHRWK